jgi:hypothetical protein
MNVYNLLKVFKVVEINNSVSIKSGHIIAQAPLRKPDYEGTDPDFVENGYILYLDVDGRLKSPVNVNAVIKASQPAILHFTEELFTTGLSEELRHFAVEFSDTDLIVSDAVVPVAYPRGIVLHVGDAFTTNNFTGTLSGATIGVVTPIGQIAVYANYAAAETALTANNGTYNGPLFHVVPSTLPDGETPAVELTVLAEVISIA